MLLKITTKKSKPFTGDDGEERDYFWYAGLRQEDGVTIKFGSSNGEYKPGDEVELLLEKTEKVINRKGKNIIVYLYREVITP